MYKILLFLLLTSYSFGQNYWQQEANYKIFVDINVKNNRYKGNQEIIYTNNSPDVLNYFCLLYTSPSPRDKRQSRMPSSA